MHPSTALSLLLVPLCTACPTTDLASTDGPPPATTGADPTGTVPTTGDASPVMTTGDAPGETTQEPVDTTAATTNAVSASATSSADTSSGGATNPDDTGTGETLSGTSTTDDADTTADATTGAAGSSSTEGGVVIETFKVEVSVIGLVADEAILQLGAEKLVATQPGDYAFTTELLDGAPYEVTLAGAPPHYDCSLGDESGFIAGADAIVKVECAPRPGNVLRITEISLGFFNNDSYWIELLNVSGQAQQLAGVTLRAPAIEITQGGSYVGEKGMQDFALPPRVLAPGERILVRGNIPGRSAAGPHQLLVALPPYVVPHWHAFGAVELRKAGESLDYLAWGSIPPANIDALAPAHPSAWPGYPAGIPVGPVDKTALGRSVARLVGDGDSNAPGDFAELKFSTPGGPNDTHGCDLDTDTDGIPDCSELAGKTYAGVPLHAYGARQNQRDIFVELDHMDPKGGDGVNNDPGMIPQRAALDRIVAVFKANGFSLHFDVGDLFDQAGGIDPTDHDLGGGSVLPFSAKVGLTYSVGDAWVPQLKADTMDLPRLKSFHYAVLANAELDGTLGGMGERPGNDLYMALGTKKYKTTTDTDKNFLANEQAHMLMHELGHNLGLSHGGYSVAAGDALVDEANWKPNYYSIMNYLYNSGLPLSLASAADRYYFEHEDENPACIAKGVDICTMSASMCGPTAQFNLDYSSGHGGDIDVAAVIETAGLKQPGSAAVDFDCDGVLEDLPYAHSLYAAVDGQNLAIAVLRDHDDWAALDLFFAGRTQGFNNGLAHSPAENDIQPLGPPDPIPVSHLRWLARR